MKLPAPIRSLMQFLFGVLLLAGIGYVVLQFFPEPETPEGWEVVRPPRDVMAIVEYANYIGEDGGLMKVIVSGGQEGVFFHDMDTAEVLEEANINPNFGLVYALLVDRSGRLWVGHSRGVSIYSAGIWETIPDLGLGGVYSVFQDKSGMIWVGGENGVASGNLNAAWRVYTVEDGLAANRVSVIFQDADNIFWFGSGFSSTGALTRFDGENWQSITVENGLAHSSINAILQDESGRLWFATGFADLGGLSIFDGENWTTITKDDGLAGRKVRSLYQDQAGVIWVGSEYDGLTRIGNEEWGIFTPDDGLAGYEIKAMLQDAEGNFWLGTENGITRISVDIWIDF